MFTNIRYRGHIFGIAIGIIVLALMLVGGAGAAPIEQWNKTFGGASNDYGYSVQQTSDGGYILAGQKHIDYPSGATGAYAWLIKTDANGTEQWNQSYGTGNDIANFARQTSDGGYIAVGWIASSATGVDAWLIKTDANGKEQWNRTYGGLKYDDATLSSKLPMVDMCLLAERIHMEMEVMMPGLSRHISMVRNNGTEPTEPTHAPNLSSKPPTVVT